LGLILFYFPFLSAHHGDLCIISSAAAAQKTLPVDVLQRAAASALMRFAWTRDGFCHFDFTFSLKDNIRGELVQECYLQTASLFDS